MQTRDCHPGLLGCAAMSRELEMKLIVDGPLDACALVERIRAHAEVGGGQQRVQRDVYLDTPQAELAGAGLSARVRIVDGRRELCVKLVPIDAGLVMDRVEVNLELGAEADAGSALRQLVAERFGLVLRGEPVETLRLRTRRTRHTVRTPTLEAELAIDDVELDDAPGFTEIELELEHGEEEALHRIAREIAALPGVSPSGRSKLARARALAGLSAHAYSTPLPRFDASWSSGRVARAVCAALHRTMRGYEPGTRIGLDPEHLHKMRVATRRLRTALRVFARCFAEDEHARLSAEYKWLGRLLGDVRDLDVQRLALPKLMEQFGAEPREGWTALERHMATRHEAARDRLLAGLDGPRYAALLESARDTFSAEALDLGERARQPIGTFGRRVLRKRVAAFERGLSKFRATHGTTEAHALRIVGKRLRYTAEFLGPLLGGDVRSRVGALRSFQDQLGDIQDMVATGELAGDLRREALDSEPGEGAYLFVLGQLAGAAAMKTSLAAPLVDRALEEARADALLASLRDALDREQTTEE